MKKYIVSIVIGLAVASAVPAKADGTAAVIAAAFLMGKASSTAPHPSLADSCKVQYIKAEGGNYSYASYAHCK